MEEKLKILFEFFKKNDLSFIEFYDNEFSISYSTWRYSTGKTVEEVVTNFLNDFKKEIRDWKEREAG